MEEYIKKSDLYGLFKKLEGRAYLKLLTLDPEKDKIEWRVWNAILAERVAYTHDVQDFESVLIISEKEEEK